MPLSGETTRNERDTRSDNLRCEHDYPMLVLGTNTGYHARCLGCLSVGPERPIGEAARQALRVLGARAGTRANS
jgi:hypothetical protein